MGRPPLDLERPFYPASIYFSTQIYRRAKKQFFQIPLTQKAPLRRISGGLWFSRKGSSP
jgi:hypothetical protein